MRWLFMLLALPACDLTPEPPRVVSSQVEAFSLGYGNVLVLTAGDNVTPGGLSAIESSIPAPDSDGDGDDETDPPMLPAIVDVAAGRRHACVLSPTGTVHCWGDQAGGALGAHRACDPPPMGSTVPDCVLGPERIPVLPPVRALAAGDDVTCATIREGDAVFCWGDRGRLGGSDLPVLDPPRPVRLPDGTPLAAARVLTAGGAVCAIDRARTLWCWGDGFGALPQQQPEAGVIDFALGARHSCIIDARGLSCWGDNRNGQVGDLAAAKACTPDGPCTISIDTPHHIAIDAQRVVVGERHTCVLGRDSKVTCFGSNEIGQLGREDAFLVGALGEVIADGFPLDGVFDLAGGSSHTCALRGSRELWCWGGSIGDSR